MSHDPERKYKNDKQQLNRKPKNYRIKLTKSNLNINNSHNDSLQYLIAAISQNVQHMITLHNTLSNFNSNNPKI